MNANHFSWGHLIATIVGAVSTAVAPGVQHAIGAHPAVSTILFGAWSILGLFLNRPSGGGAY